MIFLFPQHKVSQLLKTNKIEISINSELEHGDCHTSATETGVKLVIYNKCKVLASTCRYMRHLVQNIMK